MVCKKARLRSAESFATVEGRSMRLHDADDDTSDAERRAAVEAVFGNADILKILFREFSIRELARVSLVCRYWSEVTHSPELWATIDFEGRKLETEQVLRVLKKHHTATKVNLKGITLSGALAPQIFQNLSRVEQLELGGARIPSSYLESVFGDLTRLNQLIISGVEINDSALYIGQHTIQALKLRGCGVYRGVTVSARELRTLSLHHCMTHMLRIYCPKLTSLDLRGCFIELGLPEMFSSVPSLESLNLSKYEHLRDNDLRHAAVAATRLTQLVAQHCRLLQLDAVHGFPALRVADLSHCSDILPSAVTSSVETWSALEQLSLDSCKMLTQLTLTHPRLSSLSLKNCTALTQITLQCAQLDRLVLDPPFSWQSKLQRIEVASSAVQRFSWCGIPCLDHVQLDCPFLTSLDLSCCHLLGEGVLDNFRSAVSAPQCAPPGLAAPSSLLPLVSCCPSLRHLKLENCSSLLQVSLSTSSLSCISLAGCANLQELSLEAPRLSELHLDDCDQLTRICVSLRVAEQLSLGTCPRLLSLMAVTPSLQRLDLRGCGMLEKLDLWCPSLQRLDFTYCRRLPDREVGALAGSAPQLSALVLSVCTTIGTPGLLSMRDLTCLRLLDLSYTDIEVLDPVFEACTGLRCLKLHACSALQPDALEPLLPDSKISPALPSLTDLDVSYCTRIPTSGLADLLMRGRHFRVLGMNGCEAFGSRISAALHRRAEEGPSHALEVLCAKTSKALRSFWLGASGMDQPELRPPALMEGVAHPVLEDYSTALRGHAPVTPLTGLKVLKLGLSGLRSLAVALPQLLVLDVSSCAELWRLHLDCPCLEEAYFQSCRQLPTATILDQLKRSRALVKLGLQHVEDDEKHLSDVLSLWSHQLEIVPNPS